MKQKIRNFFYLQPAMLVASTLSSILVLIALYYSFAENKELLTRFTAEDGFIEWLQFILFTATSFIIGLIAYIEISTKKPSTIKKIVLIGLSALFMLGALEEISWFQRIADIQSSEFFLKYNRQSETNLHNMTVGDTSLNKDIIVKLMFLFLLTHNLILPLVARKKTHIKDWVEKNGFYLPSMGGVLIYLFLVILAEIFVQHNRRGEVLETISAIHYFAISFSAYYLGDNYKQALIQEAYAKKIATICFGFILVFLFYISWILGNMSLKDFML